MKEFTSRKENLTCEEVAKKLGLELEESFMLDDILYRITEDEVQFICRTGCDWHKSSDFNNPENLLSIKLIPEKITIDRNKLKRMIIVACENCSIIQECENCKVMIIKKEYFSGKLRSD